MPARLMSSYFGLSYDNADVWKTAERYLLAKTESLDFCGILCAIYGASISVPNGWVLTLGPTLGTPAGLALLSSQLLRLESCALFSGELAHGMKFLTMLEDFMPSFILNSSFMAMGDSF